MWVRGTPIEAWSTQRGLMVLRYLVLHRGKPIGRETLMDLLWPHSSANAARNNLNVAIYGLRRSLEAGGEGPFVIHQDGAYSISCSLSLLTDVEVFEELIREADQLRTFGAEPEAERRYLRAMEIYRGPLFADDCSGDWYLMDRRLLSERNVWAIECVAGFAFGRGDMHRCVDLCHEMLRLDRCRETAHRLLMRAYAAIDQYQLVARQYADCVAALQEDLDVAPHPDTTALFKVLLRKG